MSTQVLDSLGIEIDLSGDGEKELSEWDARLRESTTTGKEFSCCIDKMEREMVEYAEKIGLSSEQLQRLQHISNQNKEVQSFAKRYGFTSSEIKQVQDEATGAFGKMDAAMQGIGALGIGMAVKSIGSEMVSLSAKNEQAATSFTVMLGSAEKAKNVMKELNEFANVTPYKNDEVIESGRALLAYGVQVKDLTNVMRNVGDVAAGVGMNFSELAGIYGKNLTSGIVQTDDLNQLAGRGIPIYQEIAKVLGISATSVRDYASKGRIGFKHLQEAFQNMTASGGKYFNMMNLQAKTGIGLWSTLTGKLDMVKMSMGNMILEGLKPLMELGINILTVILKNEAALTVLKIALMLIIPFLGVFLVSALWNAVTALNVFNLATLKAIAPIAAIIGFFIAMILLIEDLYTWMNGGQSIFGAWLGEWSKVGWLIKTLVIGAIIGIGVAFGLIVGWIPVVIAGIIWLIYDLWKAFTGGPSIIKKIFDTIINWFVSLGEGLWNFAGKYGKYILLALFPLSAIYFYWDQIVDFFSSALSGLWGLAQKYGKYIIMALFPLSAIYFYWDQIVDFFKSIPGRLSSLLGTIKEFFKNAFKGILPEWALKLIGAGSGNEKQTQRLEGRARGGAVQKGTPYIVGEEGEELFIPDQSGTIIPNESLGPSDSSQNKNISFTFSPQFNIQGSSEIEESTLLETFKEWFEETAIPQISAKLGLEV